MRHSSDQSRVPGVVLPIPQRVELCGKGYKEDWNIRRALGRERDTADTALGLILHHNIAARVCLLTAGVGVAQLVRHGTHDIGIRAEPEAI